LPPRHVGRATAHAIGSASTNEKAVTATLMMMGIDQRRNDARLRAEDGSLSS